MVSLAPQKPSSGLPPFHGGHSRLWIYPSEQAVPSLEQATIPSIRVVLVLPPLVLMFCCCLDVSGGGKNIIVVTVALCCCHSSEWACAGVCSVVRLEVPLHNFHTPSLPLPLPPSLALCCCHSSEWACAGVCSVVRLEVPLHNFHTPSLFGILICSKNSVFLCMHACITWQLVSIMHGWLVSGQ